VGVARLSAALRNEFFTLLRDALAEAEVLLLTGVIPASPDTPLSGQSLRATLQLAEIAGPDPFDGSLTLTFDGNGEAEGANPLDVPTWARFHVEDVGILDVDVGLADSGALLRFDSLTWTDGQELQVSSAVLRFREGN
jgi:hypothetical protein